MEAEVLPPTDETDLLVLVRDNPVAVFTDDAKYSEFYSRLKAETEKLVPDVTTRTGRDAIKAMAFNVTKAKTRLDKAGLELTEGWREQTNLVNAARRKIKEELTALSEEVRAPLTEWEEKEKAREHDVQCGIDWLRHAATVTLEDTAETVRTRGNDVYAFALPEDLYRERLEEAQALKAETMAALRQAMLRLEQEEADKAELARLRAANEERERLAAEQAEAEAAAERQREADRLAEEAKALAAQEEADRIERARVEAAEEAQRVAAAAAQAEIDAANERARKAEEQAENDRKAAAAEAEHVRLAAEQAAEAQRKREADQAHRTNVKSAAKNAIMSCGADEETAKKIVMALIAGEVPHCRIEF